VGDETRDEGRTCRLQCALGGATECPARATRRRRRGLRSLASRRGRPPTAVSTRGQRTRQEKVRNGRADGAAGCSPQEWRLWISWCLGALVGWPAGPLRWSLVGWALEYAAAHLDHPAAPPLVVKAHGHRTAETGRRRVLGELRRLSIGGERGALVLDEAVPRRSPSEAIHGSKR
jgi:hypothetical protein